jgi:outer membrane protein assembly complex protein YaeT
MLPLLGLLLVPAHSRAVAISGVVEVTAITIEPPGLLRRAELTAMTGLAAPGRLTAEDLARARESLLRTGRFATVELDWVPEDPDRGRLTVRLTPRRWVRRIRFRGNRQTPDATIRAALTLREYAPLDAESFERIGEEIEELYERRGYPRPRVDARIDAVDEKGGCVVSVKIEEGSLPRLDSRRIVVRGMPRPWARFRTVNRLRLACWRALRRGLNIERLRRLAAREEQRLRRVGYPQAALTVEAPSAADGPEELLVTIDFGRRLRIATRGIGPRLSRRILRAWKRRGRPLDEAQIQRLAETFAERLQEKGYLYVRVQATREERRRGAVIRFVADKGPRSHVAAVELIGNEQLPAEELLPGIGLHPPRFLGLSRSRPGPRALAEAARTLRGIYAAQGFSRARVEPELIPADDHGVTVRFRIREGPRRRIAAVSFTGVTRFPESELRRITGLEPGVPYHRRRLDEGLAALRKAYWELGYTEVRIEPRLRRAEGEDVALSIAVTEGPAFRLAGAVVQGNFKTSAGTILAQEPLRPGEPFDYAPLARLQQRLIELEIFDSVRVSQMEHPQSDPPARSALIKVSERRTGYLEAGLDLNTQRGLELQAALGDSNLLGRAVDASLELLLGRLRSNASLGLARPLLFGLRLRSFLRVSYSEDRTHEGFALADTALETGISRAWGPRWHGRLAYRLENERIFDVDPDVNLALVHASGRVASLAPSLTRDTRDDPFRPHRGSLLTTQLRSSHPLLGADVTFHRWEGDARTYLPLAREITLAAAWRMGRIWSPQRSDLPLAERFYLGGANTHRGFPENELGPRGEQDSPLGGEAYLLGNLELRFPLWRAVHGAVFLDAGNNFLHDPEPPYLRTAVGLGLRLDTPVGPLRADIGLNLDPEENERTPVLHIALGHAF